MQTSFKPQSPPSGNLEQQKAEVQNTIQDLTTTFTQARQRLQEMEVTGGSQFQAVYKKNLELIDLTRGQIHHIVNEYFKDVSDNYVLLQSRYPSNEVKELVLRQIDQTLVQLNEYSQKLNSQQFNQQDYAYFIQANFPRVQDEIVREADNLQHQTANVQKSTKISQECLPQVKINHRVVEGLYLSLNEYATVQWPGDLSLDALQKPQINAPSYFTNPNVKPLPVIDDEKNSYGFFNLQDQRTYVLEINKYFLKRFNPWQLPTTLVAPDGLIYMIGGISQQRSIVSTVHVLDPATHHLTSLAPLAVKRAGCSACYVPPNAQSSQGYIYVFGGRTDNMVKTKLCERYNIEKNTWEQIPKMLHGKARPACCYEAGSQTIYLFFGTDSNHHNLNVIEKFNIVKNEWVSISLTNYLPGFDVTMATSIQMNKDLILIFGGMRDSVYFKEQMYLNRKIMVFNITNDTFAVHDWQLPVDFIPLTNPVIENNKIYAAGSFIKSMDEQPQMFLDGAFILQIDFNGPKIIKYVKAFNK